jgi:hypothetical protein
MFSITIEVVTPNAHHDFWLIHSAVTTKSLRVAAHPFVQGVDPG